MLFLEHMEYRLKMDRAMIHTLHDVSVIVDGAD